jgi:hypothetical protein
VKVPELRHPGHSVVIVGGGPRGTGLLERIVANAPELLGDRPLTVHVVEPFTIGAGRTWRADQSPLLWANSQAEDMTMFTDTSCRIEGPVVPGPTFLEWARLPHVAGSGGPELDAERAAVHGMTFPTRRLLTEYLAWAFRRAVRSAPPNLVVRVHADRAVDVTDTADGRQLVHLERAVEPLVADAVLLAQGHLSTVPLGPSAQLVLAAAEQGLTYLPEEYTADSDLSVLEPGQNVLVRGAGLAFIDLMVLVTQGRGGQFTEEGPDGRLGYHPSGREPRLSVGSRRGVPYHSKITYRLTGPRAPHPRFLTPQAVDALLAPPAPDLDFRVDVWPLLARELAFGHYHELFAAHPEAVRAPWSAVETALAVHPWDSTALAAAVPDPADRFDPGQLDRPLRDVRLPDADALQRYLIDYVEADLARRADPRRSADLGCFNALLAVIEPLSRIVASGRLSPRSAVTDVPWFIGFFSYVASGPPPARLRELLALVRAGVVRFLGADIDATIRPATTGEPAVFVATSPTMPGAVTATALVEARIPRTSLSGTADTLLAALYARGAVSEAVFASADGTRTVPTGRVRVTPDTSRVVDIHGVEHPARYAFGSGTSAATAGAFSRPGTNAAFFRQNDHAMRRVLRCLAQLADPGPSNDSLPARHLPARTRSTS